MVELKYGELDDSTIGAFVCPQKFTYSFAVSFSRSSAACLCPRFVRLWVAQVLHTRRLALTSAAKPLQDSTLGILEPEFTHVEEGAVAPTRALAVRSDDPHGRV